MFNNELPGRGGRQAAARDRSSVSTALITAALAALYSSTALAQAVITGPRTVTDVNDINIDIMLDNAHLRILDSGDVPGRIFLQAGSSNIISTNGAVGFTYEHNLTFISSLQLGTATDTGTLYARASGQMNFATNDSDRPTITIGGGTVIPEGTFFLIFETTATLNVDAGAVLDFANSAASQFLRNLQGAGTVGAARSMTIVGGNFSGTFASVGTLTFSRDTTWSGIGTDLGEIKVNSGRTLTVSGGQTMEDSTKLDIAGTLRLDTSETAASLTGTGAVVIASGQTLAVGRDNTSTTFSGVISGAGGLTKEGSGTMSLSGENTYTGGTTISGGTLRVGDGATSGWISGDVSISSGAQLAFSRSDTMTFGGVINGGGSLTKGGAGTIILTGSNSYFGGTTINSGTLQIGNGGTTGSISGNITNNSALVFNRSDDLSFSGNISGFGSVTKSGAGALLITGDHSYSGGLTVSAGYLQIGNGGTTGSVSGNIVNNAIVDFARSDTVTYAGSMSGTGEMRKSVAGTLILTGNNTHTGGTRISGGTLQIGNGGTTGSISGNIVNNATLAFNRADNITYAGDISGSGQLTKSGAGALVLTGTHTFTGGTTIQTGTLQIGNGGTSGSLAGDIVNNAALAFNRSDSVSYSGAISGSGALTKLGGGSLVLTGANSFTGGTTITDGTLQIGNGGTTGSITGDIVNNAALAFNRSNTVTYSSVISGSGRFVKTGTGTLILTGANTYTGGTTISGGTLQIGNGGTTGSITGNVVNNGILAFDRSDAISFAGAISGSGSLVKSGAGDLSLSGANTYSGGTTINSGRLVASAGSLGTGAVVNNATLVMREGSDTSFAGDISGTGSLIKEGAGRLNLTGTHTYSGATTVSAGRLAVNGSLASSIVSVQNGASLGGTGTIGGLLAASSSTIAPGNSIGTLTVAGNATLSAGSIYEVEVNAAGQSDRLVVTGTATISGAQLRVLAENGTYQPSTTYGILTATGGITGTFASVSTDLAFLDPTLSYDGNTVSLTLKRNNVAIGDVSQTGNQGQVGNAVQAAGLDSVLYQTVLRLSAEGARSALDQLSGEVHASEVASLLADSLHSREAALNRLRFIDRSMPRPDGLDIWSEGMKDWRRSEAQGRAAAAEQNFGGFVFGADGAVFDNGRFGAFAGVSNSALSITERSSSATATSYHVGVYGGAQWAGFSLRSGLAYGWSDIETRRHVSFGGFSDNPTAAYSGQTIQAFAEAAYALDSGPVSTEIFAGLAHVYQHLDGFTETGGAAALSSRAMDAQTTSTTLGLRSAYDVSLGDMEGVLKGAIGWRHTSGDTDAHRLMSLPSGTPFEVQGVGLAEDVVFGDLGLDLALTSNATLGLSYRLNVSATDVSHSVLGRLQLTF